MNMNYLAVIIATGVGVAVPVGAQAVEPSQSTMTYVAKLTPMNSKVTKGETTGEARFVIKGNTLTINVDVRGAPPNIEHWQHFHGFKDGRSSKCPTAVADANHDGIIDLIETEPAAGTTMVPFNADPAGMQIASNTYPKASASGTFHYQEVVSLTALSSAFAKAFNDQKLDLDRRVVFIHGVVPAPKLPSSVASLGPVPASVTLPIACGQIKRVEH